MRLSFLRRMHSISYAPSRCSFGLVARILLIYWCRKKWSCVLKSQWTSDVGAASGGSNGADISYRYMLQWELTILVAAVSTADQMLGSECLLAGVNASEWMLVWLKQALLCCWLCVDTEVSYSVTGSSGCCAVLCFHLLLWILRDAP